LISLLSLAFELSSSSPKNQCLSSSSSFLYCYFSFFYGFVIVMDWGNVTAEDLIDALREVDWSSLPRPLSEFFSRFTLPKSSSKWNSRLKCNLY
jgi:hypothetical protein